jgi:hypothetical protein
MECGTCGKPREGGREKEKTKVHREQDKADRSRHDNKTTSVEREERGERREREMNTDEKQEGGAHMYARKY